MVSVVIATKNRPEELGEAFRSLTGQTVLPSELVVIDQSEESRSDLFDDSPFPVVYVHDPTINGVSQARNRGIDASSFPIVLFLDDDVVLEPEFIHNLLRCYEEHPKADGVSGTITNYPPYPRYKTIFEKIFYRGPFFDERQPIYRYGIDTPVRVDKFTGCVMSFRRSSIGGVRFHSNVVGASFEDVDFCYQMNRPYLLITPFARLLHKRTSTARTPRHWLDWEACSGCYYFCRHYFRNPVNWFRFAWFCLGMAVAGSLSSLRNRSLSPLREVLTGARTGLLVGLSRKAA